MKTIDTIELVDELWDGSAVAPRGCGAVHIPVGGGRRRFVREAAKRTASKTVPMPTVLVVTRTRELAEVWRTGLLEVQGGDGPASKILVVPVAELEASEPVTLLVIDEPSAFSNEERAAAESVPHNYRIDLELTAARSAMPRGHTSAPTRLSPQEYDVGRLVARLLDGNLDQRQPATLESWFCRELALTTLHSVQESTDGLMSQVMAWNMKNLIDSHQSARVSGVHGATSPVWSSIKTPAGSLPVPRAMWVAFPSGTVLAEPCGVALSPGADARVEWTVVGPPQAAEQLQGLFRQLQEWTDGNPYKRQTLQIVGGVWGDLSVRVVDHLDDQREHLELPTTIWRDIDDNVTNFFSNADLLARLGLGRNRGILLSGPPGTGKTGMVRIIASELAGAATIIFVDTNSMSRALASVYRLAEMLAPSVVILEDIDLIVRERGGSYLNDRILVEFLAALDGPMTRDAGVVTIATTNDVGSIDPAARRAARFDRIIDVPLPPREGRERIWRRYLHGIDSDVDLDVLVSATAGGSGAEIREIVRHAILRTNGHVTTEVLLTVAMDYAFHIGQDVGQYL